MSLLAIVLACLACTGHGRRVHMTSEGPAHQAGLPGRVEAPSSSAALAYLLLVRGGVSGYGGRGGFVEPLPMTPSRSKGALRSKAATFEPEDAGRTDFAYGTGAADIRAASEIRKAVGAQSKRSASSIGNTVLVQGGSLKTWSYRSSVVDHVQVVLTTDGRPLDADVQLWQGPDNTPCKMRVYSEDGLTRPFSAVIATPYGGENTVAVRNVGQIEFPLSAHVTAREVDYPYSDFREASVIVQGGSLRTFNFDTSVESVEIMLKTDGRPLNARIELLQGPNNNKQVIELYTEDGLDRPFFAVINTMGTENVVRCVNTAPIEFPMIASVQPHSLNQRR
mmetsp:Transcript_96610/g.176935  ORF Transcript_96610/g.176935 Transcript_96610/m.176935 type:complete len:336 (-) Transcript_96610:231-1238(-)